MRYAQIEKEALATTWACDRCSNFLSGKTFHIECDHKPLVSLLGPKTLDELPPSIQRFRMRIMRVRYSISHVPGNHLITADTAWSKQTDQRLLKSVTSDPKRDQIYLSR